MRAEIASSLSSLSGAPVPRVTQVVAGFTGVVEHPNAQFTFRATLAGFLQFVFLEESGRVLVGEILIETLKHRCARSNSVDGSPGIVRRQPVRW